MFCISCVSADSFNTIISDPEQQYNYADSLFNANDYSAAIEEFKRFIYFFPNDKKISTAEYKIGLSNFHNRNYTDALDYFLKIHAKSASSEIGFKSGLMISRIYEALNNTRSAADNLHDMLSITEDISRRDEIFYYLGWLYIESGDVKQGRNSFETITESNQRAFMIKPLNEQLDEQQNIPQKKPLIAGLLSVIPGGGYLYCERYRDAFISFVINSALVYGAYESFDNDMPALGGIITAIELGFYTGNVYGGISSAHKYNQTEQTKFINNLKKKFKMTLSFDKKEESLLLGVICHF